MDIAEEIILNRNLSFSLIYFRQILNNINRFIEIICLIDIRHLQRFVHMKINRKKRKESLLTKKEEEEENTHPRKEKKINNNEQGETVCVCEYPTTKEK